MHELTCKRGLHASKSIAFHVELCQKAAGLIFACTVRQLTEGTTAGGVIEGDVRINGHPKVQETFTRVSGYVEQTDVHNTYTTVQEALEFSAALRISDTSKEILQAFVAEIMELVELTSLRNLVVQYFSPFRGGVQFCVQYPHLQRGFRGAENVYQPEADIGCVVP